MILETVSDIGRVLAGAAFLYVWVRWSWVTKWGRWWDTRALFVLFWTIASVIVYAIISTQGWLPDSWRPWAPAVIWFIVFGSGMFLAVGFEVEQRKAKARRAARLAAETAMTDER